MRWPPAERLLASAGVCLLRRDTGVRSPGTGSLAAGLLSHFARAALIYASILLQIGVLRAAPVGEAQARLAASAYVGRNYAPSSIARAAHRLAAPSVLAVSACRPIAGASNPVGFVVALAPAGFVLVRADDDLPPIKLHSSAGSYEALPPGFRAVIEAELAGEQSELAGLRRARGAAATRFRSAWASLAQSSAPMVESFALAPSVETLTTGAGQTLLATTWGQDPPYNGYAPVVSGGDGGHAPAGCGPVAMAQIIRYHQQPDAPAVDATYTDSYGSCVGKHRISDVGGLGDYDWANMPANVTTASPLAQRQAVGRLMYHCAVALEADFEPGGTSVISQFYAARALREVFGYSCEDYQSRSSYATPAWYAKIQADVAAERPIYYAMASALGGHAVVCDGYRNGNEIHLNFGYSGYGDAWYDIDSVVFYNYSWSRHEAVFGITAGLSSGSNTLTVVSGAGGGRYLAGTPVEVSADTPPLGYLFSQWTVAPENSDLGAGFVQTQAVTSVTMPNRSVTLTAVYQAPNQTPVFANRSPVNERCTLNEGFSLAFGVTASDGSDPDPTARGMVSVTWLVDGFQKQVVQSGAPNAITSAFTYKPDTAAVQGATSKEVTVRAVALDRQGGTTESFWTVCVSNVPASQAVTFNALPVTAPGDADLAPGATSSSGLPVFYTSSDESVAQVVGGLIHVVGAGTALIAAGQAGNADYKAATPVRQTLTVKARLAVEIPGGGGTVTGAGLYAPGARVALTAKPAAGYTFLRWENGSQAAARGLVMPNASVTVSALFKPTSDVSVPGIGDPGPQQATVGVFFSLPVDVTSESAPTVTVTGLPTGLKYAAATKSVTGVPKAAVANWSVTITARNVKATVSRQFTLTVAPLPAWAVGAFSGTCAIGDAPGVAAMTVSARGGISGKLAAGGTNYTFKAGSFTNAFTFAVMAVAGRAKVPLAVSLTPPGASLGGPVALGAAEGRLDVSAKTDSPTVVMYRNVWRDADMAAAAQNDTGYYTATLPGGGEYGSGYLTFTVDKVGGVKTAGKLADGTTVSLSGTLIVDERGRVWTVLYTAPTAYRGGCFFGVAEFVKPEGGDPVFVRLLDGDAFYWESRNPQATEDYGAGFSREPGLTGGRYDKLGNLYTYYRDRVLTVGTDDGAPVPEVLAGASRAASDWWNPDGLALTVVTNRLGVMTGLSAPRPGAPLKGADGAYDYGATNAVGLSVTLARATGVFKGAFKAWFDDGATHIPRSIAFEGALTPEREDAADGVGGRGFFLWSDKSQYPNPLGQPVPYSFNGSYDFLLLTTPAEE